MANGDLIARLKLDSKEFDTSISKSRRQVTDFQRNTDSFASAGIKAFAGFAGGVLAAGATLETFNSFMNSTQTSADMLEFNVNAAKNTVEAFFSALNLGDWSAFNEGIINTFRNLKELEAVWAEIDDKRLSLGYITADDARNMAKFREAAMDSSNPYETRKNNLDSYRTVVLHQNNENDKYIQENLKAITQDNKIKLGYDITIEDMDEFWRYTNASEELKDKYAAIYNEFLSKQKEVNKLEKEFNYEVKRTGYNPDSKIQKEYSLKVQELKLFEQQNLKAIKQARLDEEGTLSREKKLEIMKQTLSLEEANYNRLQDVNKLEKKISKGDGSKSSSSKAKEEIAKDGSVEDLENKISKLKKELKSATTDEARRLIQMKINELEKILKEIDDKLKKSTTTPELYKSSSRITGEKPIFKSAGSDIKAGKITSEELFNLGDDSKKSNDLDYITSMTELMANLSTVTNGASSNWLQYTSNILTGVGQMLPQLWALLGINTNLAITQAAMKTPFPLNIIALASTASAIMGAMVNVPKFADGGIVPGTSFSGDKVLAGLNSGEMILNKSQQANLFGLLNSGSAQKTSVGGGEVQFKLQGKDLVGVLTNYNNKFSRI